MSPVAPQSNGDCKFSFCAKRAFATADDRAATLVERLGPISLPNCCSTVVCSNSVLVEVLEPRPMGLATLEKSESFCKIREFAAVVDRAAAPKLGAAIGCLALISPSIVPSAAAHFRMSVVPTEKFCGD